MPRGGARPGSGRKPGPVVQAARLGPIREAEQKITDRLPWIVDRLFELAEGVCVEATAVTGQTVVYQKPPDRAACEYLMDRIMGKPLQPFETRERAKAIADELGITIEEVLAEAARLASGTR